MDAATFGLELIAYMGFRMWKKVNENAVGAKLVLVAVSYSSTGGVVHKKFVPQKEEKGVSKSFYIFTRQGEKWKDLKNARKNVDFCGTF